MNPKHDKVLLVGNCGHTSVSGLSVAFDILVSGFRSKHLPHIILDKSVVGSGGRSGSFHVSRAFNTLLILLIFWMKFLWVSRVYITIASSRVGFLRDAAMIWSSRLLGRRVILHLHGGGYLDFYRTQPEWFQRIVRTTLSQAESIVVLGELLRDQFGFLPQAQTKVRVVPNGLPLGLQPENVAPKSLPDSGPIRILYLSNMIESKGYLETLAACRILNREMGVAARCDFCGAFSRISVDETNLSAEEAMANFVNLVREWGLEDCVTYHGVVLGREKEQLLRQAHVFALPTSYPWEGQPISIIEALAFGTPVVTTRFKGIPELIREGYNGCFVEPNAPEQIARAIRDLARDPQAYRRASDNAISHYRNNFTQEMHLQRLISVILGRPV